MIETAIYLIVFVVSMVYLQKKGLGLMAWVIVLMPLLIIGLIAFFIWRATRAISSTHSKSAAAILAEQQSIVAAAAAKAAELDAIAAAENAAANPSTCAAGQQLFAHPSRPSHRVCSVCDYATFKTTAGNSPCAAWKTCPKGQGLISPGSATTDITCADCDGITKFSAFGDDREECSTVAECATGYTETAAPTASSDRICALNGANGDTTGGTESYYNYDPMEHSELNYGNFN